MSLRCVKNYTKLRLASISLNLGLMLIIGCAKPNPQPFLEFQASLLKAQEGVAEISTQNIERNRKIYLERIATNPNATYKQITFTDPSFLDCWSTASDGLSFCTDYGICRSLCSTPYYLHLRQASIALTILNEAFQDYIQALHLLASNDYLTQDDMKSMAEKINSGATKGWDMLERLGSQSDKTIGIQLLSTAVVAILDSYINMRRIDELQKAMTENQINVERYSEHIIKFIDTDLVTGVIRDYDRSTSDLIFGPKTPEAEKRKIAEAILEINDQFMANMQGLNALKQMYTAVPEAHREVTASLGQNWFSLAAVKRLGAYAKEIKAIYDSINKED